MNAVAPLIEDVQGRPDLRRMAIDRVGIKDIVHPVRIRERSGQLQNTVAKLSMYVNLPHQVKGTHMSRFVEVLHRHDAEFSTDSFAAMLGDMALHLGASAGRIEMTFPYFRMKHAPVSGAASLMNYEATMRGEYRDGRAEVWLKVLVAATSLCPCSKKISAYGAHNQRSHITVAAKLGAAIPIEDLIDLAEREASCELYGILKRPDEKYVTERAYDNPKFVEDLVRDLAVALDRDERVLAYVVESENFESIHNHSAYAMIEHDKQDAL
jgi:GTP cyclohydrolase I